MKHFNETINTGGIFLSSKIQIHGRSNGLHNVYTIMLGGFRGHAPLDK